MKEENMELLSDAVGIRISAEESESPVGDFYTDMFVIEEATGRKIIIENQLGPTDHDHLRKLIPYAAGKDASFIIWIVKEARPEHLAAIEWLNDPTDPQTGFFLCELKLYKIGDSDPAVKFEIIEQPNHWSKDIRMGKSDRTIQYEQFNKEYWEQFINWIRQNPEFCSQFRKLLKQMPESV